MASDDRDTAMGCLLWLLFLSLPAILIWLSESNDQPQPASVRPSSGVSACDPNYSGCVPDVPYDLDCSDVSGPVYVRGSDPNGFDGDGDGIGCE